MFIEQLTVKGFGKITGLAVKLEKGLNIIYGGNESGKSTLLWFIRGMLYGLRGGRTSRDGMPPPLKRYRPWTGNDFGGSLQYRLDNGNLYRVDRDFDKNTAVVYDSSFNNITGSFDSSRERGLMFADSHLGLSEICFDKTVLVRQMEARLDDDGSGELVSRLVNVSQTGQEDLSFKKASEVLRQALKNNIGTDRTTTQPADRIDARLRELKEARSRLTEERDSLAAAENELRELSVSEYRLKKRKAYLDKVKEAIEDRKLLEEESNRLSGLSEAAAKLSDVYRELMNAREELKRLQDTAAASGNTNTGALKRKRSRRKTVRPATILIFAAVGAFTLWVIFNRTYLLAAAAAFLVSAGASVLARKRKENMADALQGKDGNSERLQLYELKMLRVIELNGLYKDICNDAAMASGQRIEGVEGLEASISEKTAAINLLGLKLKQGTIAAAAAGTDFEPGFFDPSALEDTITQADQSWLGDSWDYEMEKTNDELLQTALKIKECETLLRDFNGDGEELQRIDEEIAVLSQKKLELLKTGAAMRLALEVLTEASQEIRQSFAPVLNHGMSRIIDGITGGRYQDLRADDALSLNTISPETGNVKSVMALSGGTADQMYLALRLAMADLLSGGKESLPVILDEVFAQYDDKRMLQTLEYLFREYGERQVILFTCKEREVEAAEGISGGRLNVVRL